MPYRALASIALSFVIIATVAACTKDPPAPTGPPEDVTLAISGMHCGGCAIGVRDALQKLPGVDSAKVSFDDKQAVVRCQKSPKLVAHMVRTIERLGYKANQVGGANVKRSTTSTNPPAR